MDAYSYAAEMLVVIVFYGNNLHGALHALHCSDETGIVAVNLMHAKVLMPSQPRNLSWERVGNHPIPIMGRNKKLG